MSNLIVNTVRTLITSGFLLAAVTTSSIQASAQEWPSRRITIVVPAPPGSATDLLGRILADQMAGPLGQPIVVENRPGGNSNIGTAAVARQAPDGYTILVTQNTLVANVGFYKTLGYDPVKDFEPISMIARTPLGVVVSSSSPIQSVSDLIAEARKRDLTYGTPGVGSPMFLVVSLLNNKIGTKMTHVPYRGSAPVVMGVASNDIDLGVAPIGAISPLRASGRVRLLAVSDPSRSPLVPDVPTLAETVPGVSIDTWFGVLAPAKTPRSVIDKLNRVINTIMRDAEVNETKLRPAGLQPGEGTTPEEFARVIQTEIGMYLDLARASNITPE